MAKVIILNGVSSAGKSSLARMIQEISETDWLHVSLDQFISMLPDGREMEPDWFVVEEKRVSDHTEVSMTNGPRGALLMQSMRDFVLFAAEKELDVMVDDVGTAEEIADYRRKLASHELKVIKVDVDLETAERREKLRGDRMIGLARQQMGRIHSGIDYDLEIVNSDGALKTCATQVLDTIYVPTKD